LATTRLGYLRLKGDFIRVFKGTKQLLDFTIAGSAPLQYLVSSLKLTPSDVKITTSYSIILEPLSVGLAQAINILPPSLAVTGAESSASGLVAAKI
jgi:hypothetical protein